MPLPPNSRIVVHAKSDEPPCPYCEKAKEWLTAQSIPFTVVDHNEAAERQAFYDSLGLKGADRTVPQIIIIDDETGKRYRIGGHDALLVSGLA